jgi:hypothetical protein
MSTQSSGLGGLFELDLGQQDLGGPIINKRITLENMSADVISYRIKGLNDSDKSWVSISRNEGVLESSRSLLAMNGGTNQRDSHTINLGFPLNQRGSFITYVAIENVENPLDSKIIRITLEVVGELIKLTIIVD